MVTLRTVPALVGLLVLTAGCASGIRSEQLRAWVGRPAADLTREWGPPTREVPDQGQRLLIYEQLEKSSGLDFQRVVNPRQAGSPREAEAATQANRGPTIHVRSYLFWVDPAGAIVRAELHQP